MIKRIRRLAAENYPVYALAADYGVERYLIEHILQNPHIISYQTA
jgi:hypothetical protein